MQNRVGDDKRSIAQASLFPGSDIAQHQRKTGIGQVVHPRRRNELTERQPLLSLEEKETVGAMRSLIKGKALERIKAMLDEIGKTPIKYWDRVGWSELAAPCVFRWPSQSMYDKLGNTLKKYYDHTPERKNDIRMAVRWARYCMYVVYRLGKLDEKLHMGRVDEFFCLCEKEGGHFARRPDGKNRQGRAKMKPRWPTGAKEYKAMKKEFEKEKVGERAEAQ